MYDGAVTCVITKGGITNEFPMTLGLHQESSLSQYRSEERRVGKEC